MSTDPKPGRWILPLVVLGMIAFTYFFVRELPEAGPGTTVGADGTTTTTTTINGDGTTTTTAGEVSDPEVQAYLAEVDDINSELQVLRTELVATNSGFDAEPREVEFAEAVSRFQDVVDETQDLVDQFEELTAPFDLESNHDILLAELENALDAVTDALAGLDSADPGVIRNAGVEQYVEAADAFDEEVGILHTAARD